MSAPSQMGAASPRQRRRTKNSDRLPDGFARLRGEGGRLWFLREGFPRDLAVNTWDAWLRGEAGQPLTTQGGRAPVRWVQLAQVGEVVIRRYFHGGTLAALTRDLLWGLRRPLLELEASEHLRSRGIATPEILGLYLRSAGAGFYRGCILTRRIPQARNLREWLEEPSPQPAEWIGMARKVARGVAALHESGCVHGDLNLANLLDSPAGVIILDLDRACLFPAVKLSQRGQNLLRLYRSLRKETGCEEPVSLKTRLLFLKEYTSGRPPLRRPLRVWLEKHWSLQGRLHSSRRR